MRTIWIQISRAYLVMWTVLCFQFYTHRSLEHSKASRWTAFQGQPFLSQLMNCIFLFMIYAPQSPALLPKLRPTRVHVQIFTAQRYTIRNQGCNCEWLKQGIKLLVWLPSTLVQPLLPNKFCQPEHYMVGISHPLATGEKYVSQEFILTWGQQMV